MKKKTKLLLTLTASLTLNILPSENKIVLLIPFDEYDTQDAFLCPDKDNYWYQLKLASAQAGYHLTTKRYDYSPDQISTVIAFNAPRNPIMNLYPHAHKILYTWEPPSFWPLNFMQDIHDQFDIVATWHDGLVDNKKYHKFNYALLFHTPKQVKPFAEKKLCCMLAANKQSGTPNELYSQRAQLISFFETFAPQDFDLYGPGWPQHLKTYRGYAPDKLIVMQEHKFSIIYENICNIPGYITEKIFDAFSAGCVPVYWGASNIADHIPKECYIAREQFNSNRELYEYIKQISAKEHQNYINAINTFLISEKAYQFSRDRFVATFVNLLKKVETIKIKE